MRLNKSVVPNFKLEYNQHYSIFSKVLLIVVIISVIFNFWISIALGVKTILIIITACIATRESEYLFYFHTKNQSRKNTALEFKKNYGYIDGVLIALLLPVGISLFVVFIASAFANFFIKNAFGGYSHNVFNVPIVAVIFAGVSYGLSPIFSNSLDNFILESMFGLPEVYSTQFYHTVGLFEGPIIFNLYTQEFLGGIPAIFLIVLGIFLIFKKVIDYIIPSVMIITMIVMSSIIGLEYPDTNYVFNNLCVGMFLLVTFFYAIDPATIPASKTGKIVYSLIIVVITMIIRELGSNSDGIIYGVLFANMLVPMINAHSGKYSNIKKVVFLMIFCIIVLFFTFVLKENHLEYSDSETVIREYYKYNQEIGGK